MCSQKNSMFKRPETPFWSVSLNDVWRRLNNSSFGKKLIFTCGGECGGAEEFLSSVLNETELYTVRQDVSRDGCTFSISAVVTQPPFCSHPAPALKNTPKCDIWGTLSIDPKIPQRLPNLSLVKAFSWTEQTSSIFKHGADVLLHCWTQHHKHVSIHEILFRFKAIDLMLHVRNHLKVLHLTRLWIVTSSVCYPAFWRVPLTSLLQKNMRGISQQHMIFNIWSVCGELMDSFQMMLNSV